MCLQNKAILKIPQYSQENLESPFNKIALKFFIKKRPQHRYFLVDIAKFLRTALL